MGEGFGKLLVGRRRRAGCREMLSYEDVMMLHFILALGSQ